MDPRGTKFLLSPLYDGPQGKHRDVLDQAARPPSPARAVDGVVVALEDPIRPRKQKHTIDSWTADRKRHQPSAARPLRRPCANGAGVVVSPEAPER